jgi:raffinose/stachyose/melibiose transport system permease protein
MSTQLQERGEGARADGRPAPSRRGPSRKAGSSGRRGSHGKTRGEERFASWWWFTPALVALMLIHYVPALMGSFYAFTDWKGIGSWNFIGLDNFAAIAEGGPTTKALINTFIIGIAFVILTNVLGLLLAIGLNRAVKSRDVIRTLLFAPVVLSSLATSYIWKFIFEQSGPLNGFLAALGLESAQRTWLGDPTTVLPAIILVMVWQHVGLVMVLYLAGLANVPVELEEAAALDGAGAWHRFLYVILPTLMPTVVTAMTLMLLNGLRVFDQIMALTGGGPYGASETLAVTIYKETFVMGRFGFGAALALVMSLIIIVLTLLQRQLLRVGNGKA